MKKYLPFLIIGFVAITTLTGGALLYRAKRLPGTSLSGLWTEPGSAVHSLGPAHAAVTLEEFGDFQCPPCGALSEPLNQLSHDFPKLRLVFRNFPLPNHQHANEAARAAEAAARQGKFWQMHDLLYREQADWHDKPDVLPLFFGFAKTIGCDVERFKKDFDSETVAAVIKADQEEGTKLGVKNTPTVFLNNAMVAVPDLAPDHLRTAVQSALRAAAETKSAQGAAESPR